MQCNHIAPLSPLVLAPWPWWGALRQLDDGCKLCWGDFLQGKASAVTQASQTLLGADANRAQPAGAGAK